MDVLFLVKLAMQGGSGLQIRGARDVHIHGETLLLNNFDFFLKGPVQCK